MSQNGKTIFMNSHITTPDKDVTPPFYAPMPKQPVYYIKPLFATMTDSGAYKDIFDTPAEAAAAAPGEPILCGFGIADTRTRVSYPIAKTRDL